MGPASAWYLVDSIYASSAALSRLAETSFHAVAARKAAFLACLHATLIRSYFTMLTTHTTPTTTAPPGPSTPAQPNPLSPPSSPDTSRAASPSPPDPTA